MVTHTVEIEKVVAGGEGLARLPEGKVLFVPYSLPGERLKVRIVGEKKDYAVGEITEILEPSPHRVEPPCSHYGGRTNNGSEKSEGCYGRYGCYGCGGCQLQHTTYEHEIEIKSGFLSEALKRQAKIEIEPEACYPSPEEWGYRTKSEHPASPRPPQNQSPKHEPDIGYYQRRSHHVVNVVECPVIHPDSLGDLHAVRRVLATSREPVYDERTGKGNLRHVILRRSSQGKRLVGLVTRERSLAGETIRELIQEMDGLVGIVQNINPRPGNRILGAETEVISGLDHLVEEVSGLRFRVSFPSFFQANLSQAERIVELVRDFGQPQSADVVCDAYAGVGMIGLSLACHAKEVIAVESAPSSVADGRHNAEINSLDNVTWKSCDTGEALGGIQPDLLILDPPRKGLAPGVISGIIKNKMRHNKLRVVYVSCNASTWARDVCALNEGGFRLKRLAWLDMFPKTAHQELVSLLEAN